MAILMAFQTPEVDVIGLTTIFGNVLTEDATRNALLLVSASFLRNIFFFPSFATYDSDPYVLTVFNM